MPKTKSPTQIRLTASDKAKVREIMEATGLPSMAAAIRWAVPLARTSTPVWPEEKIPRRGLTCSYSRYTILSVRDNPNPRPGDETMTTEERNFTEFLDRLRTDLVEQPSPSGGREILAQAPRGVVGINPYLGTVELSFFQATATGPGRKGSTSVGGNGGQREGPGSTQRRDAGARDLNSDF